MGIDRGACGGATRGLCLALLVIALLVVVLSAAPGALAASFTVNSASDTDNGTCDASDCTLREAIEAANGNLGADTIDFGIGVGGSYTIMPFSALPIIDDSVTIDATTQRGYVGAPQITIDGAFLPPSDDGLTVSASATTIRGLAITRFNHGIVLSGPGNDTVVGNYLGYSGAVVANTIGIGVYSPNNHIGGPAAGDANVISGNSQAGVDIAVAGGNRVLGNFIGTDPSGTSAAPNGTGVSVASDSNTIGDVANGRRNVISGNAGDGVAIDGVKSTTVDFNYIGTDVYGTSALPNGGAGLHIHGGTDPASGTEGSSNVISGNDGAGVLIDTTVPGNAQGLDFFQNRVGTDASGQRRLGNTGPGILIAANGGAGIHSIRQNTIAHNSKGIVVGANNRQNEFFQNQIYLNAGLGIDLGDDGPTGNDPNDADSGANDLINSPVITSVVKNGDGSVEVVGTYDGIPTPGLSYRLEFFSTPSCDASGFGEGPQFLGTTNLTSDANGDFAFDLFYAPDPGVAAPGSWITATADDQSLQDETSEFSPCKQIPTSAASPLIVTTTAASGPGSLHDAIEAANAVPGTDTITFNLADPPFVIQPTDASPLPAIADPVIIDGNTQPGTTPGSPKVQIDGSLAPTQGIGLDVAGALDPSTIRGLSITGFSRAGIELEGGPSVVEGNYLGVTPVGLAAANGNDGFSDGGIVIRSGANTVGGTTAATRNVISGNKGSGIEFGNEADNVVIGNRIGTDPAGTAAVPNTASGIRFEDVSFQTIGSTAAGAGNLISGNGGDGIFLNSGYEFQNARFEGNTIGLAADGKTPLPNAGSGINADSVEDVRIGGAVAGAGNVISGNSGPGIKLTGATRAVVQGNLIGVSADGSSAAPNASESGSAEVLVQSSDDVLIGGTTAKARNVVSGPGSGPVGVWVTASAGATISGNYIGTDAAGQNALGNAEGVRIDADSADNTVGGATPGAGNVISGSNGAGILLSNAGTGNRIVGNSIGTDAGETATIPNDIGVELDNTAGTQVGSTSPGAGNVIAGSFDAGILMFLGSNQNTISGNFIGTDRGDGADFGNATGMRFVNGLNDDNLVGPNNFIVHSGDFGIELDAGARNRISANSIHDNGSEGIHLAGGGANNDQEAPVLTSASQVGSTTDISGTLHSTALTTFFIEYFDTSNCTGAPQGQAYLGFNTVTTDASGDAVLDLTTSQVISGDAITATATNQATLDTSEFSNCATVNTPGTFVVTTADDHDGGICDSDCTLREAINAANGAGIALAHIDFGIPGGGPQQIALGSALPPITTPVVIDGTTEGAPAGDVGIVLNGDGAALADGLVLAAGSGGSTVEGIAIRDFAQADEAAIRVRSDGNLLIGNYIGTDGTGTGANGNTFGIVVENSNDNVIGGTGAGERNVIVDSANEGILIDGTLTGADSNTVAGNYIGVDATGQIADGNHGPGVRVVNASSNVVGGPAAADGNVISANFVEVFLGAADVTSSGNSNIVQNNLLGLSADQTVSFPDSSSNGVEVMDAGSDIVSDNTIASQYQGIDICGASNNIVSSNTIGTNASLAPDFGVINQGISTFGAACLTGGGNNGPGRRNIISGNLVVNSSLNGIAVDSIENNVAGNTVTKTKDGAAIESMSFGNTIGPNNSVHDNLDDGVQINLTDSNTITRNSIDANGGKGIALNGGANDGQSSPVLAGAASIGNGSVRIQGTLTSNPGRDYTIEYFASPSCDASGSGEGGNFIGFSQQQANAAGVVTIDTGNGLSALVSPGEAVTATATDSFSGSTSEFSACVTATDPTQTSPFLVNSTADPGDGACTVTHCTLREAINAAVAAPGSEIHFDLPADQETIAPDANLPAISAATTIDATTQPGYAGAPLVTLDGTGSTGTDGFVITADNATIRGFSIIGWTNDGIRVANSDGNTIAGNYIGVDTAGANSLNNNDAVELFGDSNNNTVGGTGADDRNVLSANGGYGVALNGDETFTPNDNTVAGNYIGLTPLGTGQQGVTGNSAGGILVEGDHNTIGGTTSSARNYVAANDDDGIILRGDGNLVKGNTVGLAVDDSPVANSSNGIRVDPIEAFGEPNVIGDTSGGGNVISGNSEDGVFVSSPTGESQSATIQGNLIGTDPSGTAAIGNGLAGIETNDASFNQIDHNTISGNLGDGVYSFGFDSHDNTIEQNRIGTNSAGTGPLDNNSNGIHFDESSGIVKDNLISGNDDAGVRITAPEPPGTSSTLTGNSIGTNAVGSQEVANGSGVVVDGSVNDTIGGVAPGDGNVISGNHGEGVLIDGANFTSVEGNTIGLNAAGTAALPNSSGVSIMNNADTTTIGGSIAGARNVISGNTGDGVLINSAGGDGGILVVGNLIGTNAAGTQKIANAMGVHVNNSFEVTIGLNSPNAGNVIAGSTGAGVELSSDNANILVEGNSIGTDSAGTLDLGNAEEGVLAAGLAGGATIRNNTIKHNGGAGVASPNASGHNTITANSIDLNGGLGIDVGGGGVTPNDSPDGDGYQNFPTVTGVSTTIVNGSLSSTGSQTFNIDLYVTPACDGSGSGEGATLLGTTTVTTNGTGTGTFTANVAALPAGQFVTATATSPAGDTSEFSACRSTVPPPIAANLTLTPASPSTPAGAARVQLSNVPPSIFLRPQSTNQTAPINDTPINDTPINDLPINDLPINDLPINDIGFDTLAGDVPALGNIALSSVPLLRTGGWAKVLSDPIPGTTQPGTPLAGLPLQSLTLRDYYALGKLTPSVNPETRPNSPIPAITLPDLDLAHSPLGSLPADALVLANVKLSDLRSLDTWCGLFGPTYCTGAGSLLDQTVMSAALNGAPINDTPINDLPINDLPINDIPINDLPINDTPINDTPINDLPINDTPINDIPINDLPINDLPINDLPINDLATANAVVFCAAQNPTAPHTVDCSNNVTLKQAFDAQAIRPGMTFGDLRDAAGPRPNAFDGMTLADVFGDWHAFDGIDIRDLIESLAPGTMTLGDYFLLLLQSPTASQGLAWERLNLSSGLAQYSTDGSTIAYRAHFSVQANGGPTAVPSPLSITSTLGDGFLYVPGTSKLIQDPRTCPSATAADAIPDPSVTTLNDGRLRLDWNVNTTVGSSYSICFTARPGIELGPQASSIDATPGAGATASATGGTLDVGDTKEPNNNADATAPEIVNDSFYLSYLTSSDDVDYYRFKAPAAGTILTFHLSHLPTDYDLVVYGPPETQLRPPIAGTMPLDEPPVTDSGADLTHQTDAVPSQTLDDLALQPGMPLVGVSASRGTDPEDVVTVSPGGSGFYTVQITGYNGATSPEPYMLRVATAPPRPTSTVPARTITGTAGPALPTTLPSGLNTVFIVNRRQLQSMYNSTRATNVMTALQNDSAAFTSLGFPNVTLSVDNATNDSTGAVAAAYTRWNANPGDPVAANAVVQSINAMVDSKIRSRPNGAGLKYIVIVGGDQIIPFARLDDFSVTSANESSYANTFAEGTDLFSSLNLSQMLSDDPYGTTAPVPYLTRQLYLPSLSVGRLVETPEDIVGTLNRFVSSTVNGRLNPSTSLTTGYDFLYDSGTTINGYMRSRFPSGGAAGSLLDSPAATGDSWTLSLLVGAFLPTTAAAPSITSLNGHASHYQFQGPRNDLSGARGDILTTTTVTASGAALTNRVVFSMGCHAGLSVADAVATTGGASTLDWAQAFAQKGTGVFLGNTGYGYGDTLVTAYSEELNRLFAQNILAGAKVGSALVAAKQAYFAGLGVFGVYDEKAMAEFTLYGLPMWGVANASAGTGAAAALTADSATLAPESTTAAVAAPSAPSQAPTANALITDPATGLDAETFSVDPTSTPVPGGAPALNVPTYWKGSDPDNNVQVTHLRPIQPKQVVGLTGTSAHGALITELSSSDKNCVTPAFDRPVFDLSAHEPALTFADVAFPSKVQTIRTYETPSGRKQQLVVVTGQFFSQPCTTDPTPPVGVQRLFTHVAGRVFRSSSNDFSPPAFQRISATQVGSNAAFTVDVSDRTPGADSVKQVIVGVRSGSSSNWNFVTLAQSVAQTATKPAHFTGGAPVSGIDAFEYFVQAVDANGNVAVSTNKGFYFVGAPAPPPPTGGIETQLTGPKTNGWFTQGAGLNIDVPDGVTVQVSVDGGDFAPYNPNLPPSITGDGVHTVDIRASNGGTAELFVPVDTSPPEVVVNSPTNGGQYVLNSIVKADYFCRDSGSGVVTPCTGSVANGNNLDTSSVGQHSITIDAIRDAAGHATGPKTVTYTVAYRKILFSSARTGSGDIYAMNPDGGGIVRLTTASALDEQPAWSPDASRIVFASARNATKTNTLDLYVMDADGSNVKRLTSTNGDDTAPSWSPDGTKIAFQSTRDGNLEIYTMNADGSAQTRRTTNTNVDSEPAWSPDGTRIAFVSDRNIGLNVWTMNTDGTSVVQLTATKQAEIDPDWSPDSSKIVLASNRAGASGHDLWIVNSTDGSNPVRLTSAMGDDNDPTFSGDGRKIAFTSNRLSSTNPDIFIANADGTSAARVTTTSGFDRQPDW
ncbi:MAG: NosD domain-containing protein [Gaiellaceae bacterium]